MGGKCLKLTGITTIIRSLSVMTVIWISHLRERRRGLMAKWTVWVGGSEVNQNLLTYNQAREIAKSWKDKGYDDVKLEEVLEW